MNTPLDSLPVAVVLWIVVYVADYYLTLYGRQLWLKNAQSFFKLGGSYELNPYYQKDVDANNRVSRRFIFMLSFGVIWMLCVYLFTQYLDLRQVFPAAVGFLVLPEMVVLSTHVQNVRLFKLAAVPDAVQGEISYARWVSLDGTAWKFGYWALVFLCCALLMSNWFFVGGVLSCFSIFLRYRRSGMRMRLQPKPIPNPSQ